LNADRPSTLRVPELSSALVRVRLPAFARDERFWVALCYLALVVAFFWPSFWSGAVPLPLMNAYVQPDPIWAAQAPTSAAGGANRLLGDVSGFYFPYLSFTIDSLRAGQFPLWNPGLFGGMPFFAANQAALLYPINLIAFWFGPHYYWVVAPLLRLLVAGFGTYALARRLNVGALGALLAGGVYMFASFNVVWLHFAIHNVAALLPLALWLIARLADRVARRDVLALAGVVAAQMFGGHPEMSLFFLVVCGAFAAVWLPWRGTTTDQRRTTDKETRRQGDKEIMDSPISLSPGLRVFVSQWWSVVGGRWSAVVLAVALGLALSAVQWVPTIDLIGKSSTLHERSFAADRGRAPAADFAPLGGVPRASWENLRHWLLLVAPELWGMPAGEQIRNWLPERTNYNEMASYFGLVALPLALAGALRGRHRRAACFFGALSVLSLLLLYPLPGLYRIGYLPLLDVAYGFRFGQGIALGGAMLAGLGLDRLVTAGPRMRLVLALALAALAALNLAVVYTLMGVAPISWALGFTPNDAARDAIAAVYTPGNWRLFLPASAGLLAVIALVSVRGRAAPRYAGALVAAIAMTELVAHGFGYNGFTPSSAAYPSTPIVAHLTDENAPARVLNLDGTFWANSAMTHGIQVTGGMDDLVPIGQRRFIERGMSAIVQAEDRQVVLDWGQRLLDLMSVGYVTSSRTVVNGPRGAELPLELQDGPARLYRNATALPRAFAASSVVQATERNAEDKVFSPAFDPHQAVVLEEAPPQGLPGAAPVRPVAIVSYTPDRVELAPELSSPAVVVLADSYDPDWRVTIDGQPARLLRANARFRGVVVPAGAHRVVFSYQPPLVAYSALISVATLVGCMVWALVKRGSKRGRLSSLPAMDR
jgi:hypothetical protein